MNVSRLPRSAFRLFALGAGLVALLLLAAGATQAANSNLLVNGGAEAGAGATSGDQVVAPPGWVTSGNFTVGRYGTQGLPAAGSGANLFAGGPASAVSTALQTVSVSSSAAAIDAGTRRAKLSALLGGWESQGDYAGVEALFLNAGGSELGSLRIGPVTESDRGGRTVLLARSGQKLVPEGTRSIRVVITAVREAGSYNDGYADNVSLSLVVYQPQARFRFGFRVFDRSSRLSAGSSGSFTTKGQPDSSGAVKVIAVNAKNLPLAWNYGGKRWLVSFRFRAGGLYSSESHVLALPLKIRKSNLPNCRVGKNASITISRRGDVYLRFCGRLVTFRSPERASSWIKPS